MRCTCSIGRPTCSRAEVLVMMSNDPGSMSAPASREACADAVEPQVVDAALDLGIMMLREFAILEVPLLDLFVRRVRVDEPAVPAFQQPVLPDFALVRARPVAEGTCFHRLIKLQ